MLSAYFLEAGGVQLSLVNDLHSYLNMRQKAQDYPFDQAKPRTQIYLLPSILPPFCPIPLGTPICSDHISIW